MTGRCLCESVRFEITGPFGPLGYCHCKQCQRATGSAFSASSTVARADVRFLSGEELLREFESSPGRFRTFCSRCGSPICKRTSDQPDALRIRLGVLDGDPQLTARAHIWVSAKAPWYQIADSLPQLPEGLPPRK